jgi:hypothetical protein
VERESRWSRQDELLAQVVDMLNALYVLTARAHGAKNVGKPHRVPRPGDDEAKQRVMSPREFAMMARRA